VGVWKGQPVLDLCYEEDSSCDTDMNVVMKGNGEFIELQGTAEHGSFSEKDLHQLLALGKKGITEIIDLEKELFKGIL
jgi:ribonuclease PH